MVDDTAAFMSPLRPRIGKENVKCGDGLRRQQISHRVARFDEQHADISEPVPSDPVAGGTNATGETFNPEIIVLRILLRERREIRAVAAADVNFQRRFARKNFAQI